MALVLKDRVKETTTTTGTGTYTLAGAVAGFEAFSEIGNSNTTYYCCTDGTDFEVGVGTYTASGTTLARTTILQSSNSDNAVNWSSGSRTIFCTQPAEKAVFLDASGDLALGGDLQLTDTDAGALAGPLLTLRRNSSSPADNDLLGRLRFTGENDADEIFEYATITGKLLDNTDGTEDGGLVLSVGQAGSAVTARVSMQGYGDTVFQNKDIRLAAGLKLKFEGATDDAHETILTVTDPTADRTITLPNATGTVLTTADSGIGNGNVATFTSGAADNDFLRIDGTSIEGRSASEVLSDIGATTATAAADEATALAIALG